MSVDHLFNLDQRFSDLTDPLKSVAGANAEPMTLWVPSEAISLHSVDIPTAPQRKWAELLPWMLGHLDINSVDLTGVSNDVDEKVLEESAVNVKRTVWGNPADESPYVIADFLEMKTVWHPIGR